MTPTGSCPRTSPGLTGYSPRTMCTSVPQMVVVVIRMTASPGPGIGFGSSSTPMRPFPSNTTAFIIDMGVAPSPDGIDARVTPVTRRKHKASLPGPSRAPMSID